MKDVRTWIEIDSRALRHNVEQFLKLLPASTRFMAVVKSNAYGHGLTEVAKIISNLSPTTYNLQPRLWFGVDSITEALRLRCEGIKNPMMVLGATLPSRLQDAAREHIAVTVSNFEILENIVSLRNRPNFHIKIDTGMHRQGFLFNQIRELIRLTKFNKLVPQGVYTHFAAAKDPLYPTYTLEQFGEFQEVLKRFQKEKIASGIVHAAASGGALLFHKTHGDMVRIGMGMYGYWPSQEMKTKFSIHAKSKIDLWPVLTWKTIISEIKEISAGSFVGYDCTEKVSKKTKVAVLPVGYWHGYDRGLSSVGEVLIRGRRAKVLGRIAMDMTVVDISVLPNVKVYDEVLLIGKQGKETVGADELSLKIGTTPYELLTRINPLIRRIIV